MTDTPEKPPAAPAKPRKPDPTIESLPEEMFGKVPFRRLSFRDHMLESFPAFRERLLEAFAEEDARKAAESGDLQ